MMKTTGPLSLKVMRVIMKLKKMVVKRHRIAEEANLKCSSSKDDLIRFHLHTNEWINTLRNSVMMPMIQTDTIKIDKKTIIDIEIPTLDITMTLSIKDHQIIIIISNTNITMRKTLRPNLIKTSTMRVSDHLRMATMDVNKRE